jgi:hypothetical protein
LAKLTLIFGVLLIALGVTGFVLTGSEHPTALIPAVFGLLLCLFGALARTEDSKKRMLWMHIAVTVGLLGFIGSAVMIVKAFAWAHGEPLARPIAVEAQAAMCLLCAIFVGLCVRSFIAARRARGATA